MDIFYTLVIILIVISLIFIVLTCWTYLNPTTPTIINLEHQVREIFIEDAHLHRLLIIETNLGNKNNLLTVNRLYEEIKSLTKILVKIFGIVVTQRLENLFLSRHDVIRDYYSTKCNDKT